MENTGRCVLCNEEMEHDVTGIGLVYVWHIDCVILNEKEW